MAITFNSKILVPLALAAAIFLLPSPASAQWQDLIVCDGVDVPCTFNHLVQLTKNLITNLVIATTILAVVAFIWAGMLLLTSQGNPGAMEKAKGMLWKVLIGYLWILAAWVVVYTITSVLLNKDFNSVIGGPQQNP